jgi:hypothetical protein
VAERVRPARGFPGTRSSAQQKRRVRPPWGDLLGGKPIERQCWYLNQKIDLGEEYVEDEKYRRMLRLKEHYNIQGGDDGVAGSPDWRPWYELAVALASELDESLRLVDAKRRSKTAARWRGPDGYLLLTLVDAVQKNYPKRSIRWCLNELCKREPEYGPLNQLVVRYYEARRFFRTKKQRGV